MSVSFCLSVNSFSLLSFLPLLTWGEWSLDPCGHTSVISEACSALPPGADLRLCTRGQQLKWWLAGYTGARSGVCTCRISLSFSPYSKCTFSPPFSLHLLFLPSLHVPVILPLGDLTHPTHTRTHTLTSTYGHMNSGALWAIWTWWSHRGPQGQTTALRWRVRSYLRPRCFLVSIIWQRHASRLIRWPSIFLRGSRN